MADYYWQKLFNRYATHFQPRRKLVLVSQKRESRSNEQKEQANKRHCCKEDWKVKEEEEEEVINNLKTVIDKQLSAMPT
jgi:hypothetical protein